MQLELPAREGLAHVEFELAARLHARVHLGLEEPVGAAAVELGAVEGEVGVLEKPVGIRAVRGGQRHADARPDGEEMALDHVGPADQVDDPAGQSLRAGGVVRTRLQDDELVAADPRHRIGGPHRRAQAIGDLLEERVADRVAEGVVDRLEPVEVDQQHGAGLAGPGEARQGFGEALAQEQPVRQAGQRIEAGHRVGRASLALRVLTSSSVTTQLPPATGCSSACTV